MPRIGGPTGVRVDTALAVLLMWVGFWLALRGISLALGWHGAALPGLVAFGGFVLIGAWVLYCLPANWLRAKRLNRRHRKHIDEALALASHGRGRS